jgi:hypothetical protein
MVSRRVVRKHTLFIFHSTITKKVGRQRGQNILCVQDPSQHEPYYKFCFLGADLQDFGIRYDLTGPDKIFASEAWFERAQGKVLST